jgi:hypothetical protein
MVCDLHSTHSKQRRANKIYITLLKEHSINYFHWVTEALPRLVQIVDKYIAQKNISWDNFVFLLDYGLPSQCLASIKIILNREVEYESIKSGEKMYCNQLVYCTPLWLSLDNTKGLPNPKKEFFVDEHSLRELRQKIITNYDRDAPLYTENKRIYLQRLNNTLRPIKNIYAVEMILHKYGFDFLNVGSLELNEQIKLFQNVDVVIGVSGASFTNILFMRENSKVINFYPSSSPTNYYIFQPLADASSVDLIHFLTTPTDNSNNVHGESFIDVDRLENMLKAL